MKKAAFTLLALAIVAGAFWLSRAYFAEDEAQAGFGRPDRPIPIEITVAKRQPLRETITYPGSVMADETVAIVSRVSGIIKQINVDVGDFVNAGDPLIQIDDAEFVERLRQAQANLRLSQARLSQSKTQVDLTKRTLDRVQRLANTGVSMLQEVDNAEAAYESALAQHQVSEAEVERVQASVEEAELNAADTKIISPLSGWVQSRNADPGALANPSAPILTIVDTDPAEVVVYIPERELVFVDMGLPATIHITSSGRTHEGLISRVAPSLSMSTRTTEIIVEAANPDHVLRPGMSTDVTLVARQDDNALVIPAKALIFQGGESAVYRVVDSVAYLAHVQTGIEQDGLIQITAGIEEGDSIVSVGQYLLKDGQPITLPTGEGATPPGQRLDT